MRRFLILLILAGAFGVLKSATLKAQDLKLEFQPEQPRQFVYSNKKAAFWYGEIQQPNRGGFQGYTILEQRYLQDYTLLVDGKILDRTTAAGITLYPDRLERRYAHLTEILHFVDSLNTVLIEIRPDRPLNLAVIFHFVDPIRQGSWKWDERRSAFQTQYMGFGWEKPSFISCEARGEFDKMEPFQPGPEKTFGPFSGGVGLRLKGEGPLYLAVLFAKTRPELSRMEAALDTPDQVLRIRQERIRRLLAGAAFRSDNALLNNAYAWALISLDDLVTEQRGKGIWAGLPWFNNYWGRDSFISFTGALLCTGRFAEAREVLADFARFQNQDPASANYGRIPNRVMLKEVIYNTADGTPWFVKACENYVNFSGDSAFIEEIFPVIQRATAGVFRHHLDENGFQTHGDAETWMDAVGSDGPWSPRGNRAVEIQALWLEQLRIAGRWARQLGFGPLADRWEKTERKLRRQFAPFFWNSDEHDLFDHLKEDGTPNRQLRPNQIFALTVPQKPLLSRERRRAVLRKVVDELTYPWGVGSLWQHDPDFHPYHHYPPYYVPDAAYHNGIVWTWLAGPLLTALFPANPDLAWALLRDESRQILNLNAVGSYSELLEAWPREGTRYPRMSGTVSQAWSLAEFIRNVHQDLMGVIPAGEDTLWIRPHLPADMHEAHLSFRLGGQHLTADYYKQAPGLTIVLKSDRPFPREKEVVLRWRSSAEQAVQTHVRWNGVGELKAALAAGGKNPEIRVNGQPAAQPQFLKQPLLTDLAFCQPTMDLNLPALKGPGFDLIPPEEVVHRPGRRTRLLFDVDDPEGDDRGPNGRYVYPTNPAFRPGIFDGKRVRIWKDNAYLYFRIDYRELVNPGWHPESGYQLTYTAIALNFGDKAGMRRTRVGMNAHFSVPFEYAYNFILYIGNGFRVENARGKVVVEYRPRDMAHPIGFPEKKMIQFSVPAGYFPDLDLRNAYVMIGGQDDHGGGGIGEFRAVGKKAGEWQGGGGDRPTGNPSVYDVIEVR